jgi:hypothetical protein
LSSNQDRRSGAQLPSSSTLIFLHVLGFGPHTKRSYAVYTDNYSIRKKYVKRKLRFIDIDSMRSYLIRLDIRLAAICEVSGNEFYDGQIKETLGTILLPFSHSKQMTSSGGKITRHTIIEEGQWVRACEKMIEENGLSSFFSICSTSCESVSATGTLTPGRIRIENSLCDELSGWVAATPIGMFDSLRTVGVQSQNLHRLPDMAR